MNLDTNPYAEGSDEDEGVDDQAIKLDDTIDTGYSTITKDCKHGDATRDCTSHFPLFMSRHCTSYKT